MTDTTTRRFHIGDILSVTSGVLVSPEHIGGVYKILNWLVDEDLMTHQLPRVSRECEPFLRELYPDLAALDVANAGITDEATLEAWLAEITPVVGAWRDVPRMPIADHTSIDPISELKMMRPDAPVIVVTPPADGEKGADRG